MANDLSIGIKGLKELRSELRKSGIQKNLTKVNKHVVNVVVVPEAKRRAAKSFPNIAGGMTRVGSKGINSIRGTATQTKAVIKAGGARVPWFQGVEWGSSGRYRQFPRTAEKGRIVYPVVEDKREEIIDAYWDVIDDVTKGPFPEGSIK